MRFKYGYGFGFWPKACVSTGISSPYFVSQGEGSLTSYIFNDPEFCLDSGPAICRFITMCFSCRAFKQGLMVLIGVFLRTVRWLLNSRYWHVSLCVRKVDGWDVQLIRGIIIRRGSWGRDENYLSMRFLIAKRSFYNFGTL